MDKKAKSTSSLKYRKAKKYNKNTEAKKYYKAKSGRPLENLGKTVGSYFGSTGMKVGKYLGRAAGIITGSGSYQINKNTLVSQQVPFVHSASECVRIRHREFLGNLNGSVAFSNQAYNINPGLKSTFPWLYTTAASFEQYKICGLIVEFVSTCADALASNNNAMGTICLSTDYNVVNEDFINMAQCQNSMWSATGKPSKNITMPIECDGKLNVLERLFLRDQNTSLSNSDLRLYDHCKINVATEGQQISTQIGQLWLSYDIEFYKPVLHDPPGPNAMYYIPATNTGLLSNAVQRFNYLGVNINNSLNPNRLYFGKALVGKKVMVYYYQYSGSTTYNWVDINYILSGATANNILLNNLSNAADVPFSAGALTALTTGPSLLVSVTVNTEFDYITFSGGVANAQVQAEILIFQL